MLSVLAYMSPAFGLAVWYFFGRDTVSAIAGAVVGVVGFSLKIPLTKLRIKARRDVEYDEFGRSKSRGTYESLSKKERDMIDLQKTMDAERVLDSQSVKKMSKTGSEDPEGDMEKLIGLVPVKEKMYEMSARMQFEWEENRRRKKKDRKNSMSGRHMVFYGAPGTGKTTVARILTGFLYEYGYIEKNKCVEIDGNFLRAGSDTALKTELTVREAFGGVLFIDEAYALMETGDGCGSQAVATLIKQMEDSRDRFILILAGYTREMRMLLGTNPGFRSRIKEYLSFPDYKDIEMADIFTSMAAEQGFEVADDAKEAFLIRIRKERITKAFGNARTVRNVLDESLDRHALNCVQGKLGNEDRHRLRGIDISKDLKRDGFGE